jgi:hypothetical protein
MPMLKSKESIAELDKHMRNSMNTQLCYHPEAPNGCSDRIINAHEISKSSQLKAIALDGVVISGKPVSMFEQIKHSGMTVFREVGIKKASTFSGFCDKHDNEFFSPIEDEVFQPTARQVALVHYRMLAREFHSKAAASELRECFEKTHNQPLNPFSKRYRSWSSTMAGLQRFSDHHRLAAEMIADEASLLSNYLMCGGVCPIRSVIFVASAMLPMSFSGNFAPVATPDGQFLQDLHDPFRPNAAVSLHTHHSEGKTWILLTWLKNDQDVIGPLVDYFFDHYDVCVNLLVEYAIRHIERIFYNPSWFRKLTENELDMLMCWSDDNTLRGVRGVASDSFGGRGFKLPSIESAMSTC